MTFGRVPIWFGMIFGGAGFIVIAIGWWLIILQQYRFATYLPVEARIISSDVETRHSSKGDLTYEPVISYTYTVQGQLHTSDRVTAVGNSSESGNWAHITCAKYPAGALRTAWYSAQDATSAFLTHDPEAFPYYLALFGIPFLAVGSWLVFQSLHGRRGPKPPAPATDGWFALSEEGTIRDRFWFFIAIAAAWYGYFALIIGDYLAIHGYHVDLFSIITGLAGGLLGIIALVFIVRYWRLWHDFLDAEVHCHEASFQCGNAIEFRLRQGVRRPLQIDEVALGAVCMRSDRTQTGSSVSYSAPTESRSIWKKLEINRAYAAGDQFSVTGQLALPADGDASSPLRDNSYPVFEWAMVLRVVAAGEPELRVYFPIVVAGAAGQEREGDGMQLQDTRRADVKMS